MRVELKNYLPTITARELEQKTDRFKKRTPAKNIMEEWQKDLSKFLDAVTEQVEDLFLGISKEVTEVVNTLVDVSEEIAIQVQDIFSDEIEQYINELVNPVLETYFGFESLVETVTQPMVQTVEPLLNQHPVCVGCQNYHGQVYSGNLLVCGMHPYGVGEGSDSCPDKELTLWKSPYFDENQFFWGGDED